MLSTDQVMALSDGTTTALAAILAALFAAVATAFAARESRRATSATVDTRILDYLQGAVVQLEKRVAELRKELFESQDETDAERHRRRRLEVKVSELQDVAERMVLAMNAAGMPIPPDAATIVERPVRGAGP